MQVAHHNDHITHAVIGGKQAIEFGISNSAEFFNILSSTLYKDQILAVVREVLCNAWDAHIEAGCTDRPVQVTLTQNEFIIKDFGKGIHHDDMGLIYGTYGNSTKKNDGNQTGGFGLGCKAPFAYTDHFEVVSCHDGIRTIYNLAKSSAQAMGKPGITPIASFPTDESGLTVKIRIKSQDHSRFHTLIERTAFNGDMNMQLNGKQLDTLEFDTSKGNFLLTRRTLLDQMHRVLVRYGNVIYPVDAAKNENAFYMILDHLNSLRGTGAHFNIVFQAPPHSIAVTPSRESLSMQDHTVNTLSKLFDGFLTSLETEFKSACRTHTEELVQQAVANKRVDELLKREEALPVVGKTGDYTTISDFNTMAKAFLHYNYPKGLDYRKADIEKRLVAMIQGNLLDRGKASTFLRDLKRVKQECFSIRSWHVVAEHNDWLQRRVLAPLMRNLSLAGLSTDQLYSCTREDHHCPQNLREGMPPLVPAKSAAPHHLLTTLPYLRNIVVITTRRQDLVDRAYQHEVFKAAGKYYGFLVYVAGRKKGELEAVRQFFSQTGMRVADLTIDEAAEAKERTADAPPRKPAKKGVVCLSSILGRHGIHTASSQNESAARIENPEFIVQVSFKAGVSPYCLGRWSNNNSEHLVRLFGDKGAITNSTATYDKWRNKGAADFDDYVREKICNHILNNPEIEAFWANQISHVSTGYSKQDALLRLIASHDALSAEFGLTVTLSDENKVFMNLWHGLVAQCRPYNTPTSVTQVRDWLEAIPPSQAMASVMQKMDATLLPYLDIDALRYDLNSESPAAVALIKKILN